MSKKLKKKKSHTKKTVEPTAGKVLIEGFEVATQRRQALASANFAAVYAPLPGNVLKMVEKTVKSIQ